MKKATGLRSRAGEKKAPCWTEAELEKLRAISGAGLSIADIAAELGRSVGAVANKRWELRLVGEGSASAAERGYMDRHQVSLRKVRQFGTEWLDRMGDEARALMLRSTNVAGGNPYTQYQYRMQAVRDARRKAAPARIDASRKTRVA